MRAIRGATTVEADEAMLICTAAGELLREIADRNGLTSDDVISVIFTCTADLKSEFPARAARDLGWDDIPLLCTVEVPVPGAMQRCIRVLVHVETDRAKGDIKHVYLRGAMAMRPDLVEDS